jgi:hypothetical protein
MMPGCRPSNSRASAFHDTIERYADTVIRPGTKLVSIGAAHLYLKANYQDFQRFQEIDLVIPADAEATLPYLVEAVKRPVATGHRERRMRRCKRSTNFIKPNIDRASAIS